MENHHEIEATLLNHFNNMMEEPQIDRMMVQDEVLSNIPRLITTEQNQLLTRTIEMMELEEVVKQLKDNKAPGPDGFTTNFFHTCWDTIKEEVLAIVENYR